MSRNKQANNKTGWLLVLLSTLLLVGQACFEPEEGCLDLDATNYFAKADDPCADCCQYPELAFNITHKFGDISLRLPDTLLTLDSSQYFRLLQFQYYISDFQLIEMGEAPLGVNEQIILALSQNGMLSRDTLEDNFSLVTTSSFSFPIGEIRTSGTFDSISFYVGVPAPANWAIPDSVTSGHPLANVSMHQGLDTGYIYNRVLLQRDTFSSLDTIQIEIEELPSLVEVALPINLFLPLGTNLTINLEVDYKTWLKGINFVVDSDDVIRQKIVNNTAEAFSILQ